MCVQGEVRHIKTAERNIEERLHIRTRKESLVLPPAGCNTSECFLCQPAELVPEHGTGRHSGELPTSQFASADPAEGPSSPPSSPGSGACLARSPRCSARVCKTRRGLRLQSALCCALLSPAASFAVGLRVYVLQRGAHLEGGDSCYP